MRIYLAGPVFSEAERAFNLQVAAALEAKGHEVYLPQRDSRPEDGRPRTASLFRANLAALDRSDVVVAICDGPQVDDGTAWEIGYAYSRRIPVYGLRTDPRLTQHVDERINLMVGESLVRLTTSVGELLAELAEARTT